LGDFVATFLLPLTGVAGLAGLKKNKKQLIIILCTLKRKQIRVQHVLAGLSISTKTLFRK
jgi:hypothetical protein